MPTGQVKASDVNAELGASGTTQFIFANNSVMNLTGLPNNYTIVTTAVFTSGSGSNTAPSDATGAFVHVWGGGGGGNDLFGGGGSGYSQRFIKAAGGSTAVSYNVGAGGAGSTGGTGGTGGSSNAQISGNSTTWSSTGGGGASRIAAGSGGSGSGGQINEDSAGGATSISGGQAGGDVSILNGGGGFQFGTNASGNPYGGGGGQGGTGSTGAAGAVKIVWIKQENTKMGRMRFGIDIPLGEQSANGVSGAFTQNHYKDAKLSLSGLESNPGGSASANAIITLNSNGTFTIQSIGGGTSNTINRTWLRAGSNSDYTAQLKKISGGTINGSATNTDLALSTTREWYVNAIVNPEESSFTAATCELIIKDSSGVLFNRAVTLAASADGVTPPP